MITEGKDVVICVPVGWLSPLLACELHVAKGFWHLQLYLLHLCLAEGLLVNISTWIHLANQKILSERDSPGCSVVKTPHFQCRGQGLDF